MHFYSHLLFILRSNQTNNLFFNRNFYIFSLASSSLPSDGVSEINSEVDYDEEEEEQLEDEVIDDPIPNFQIEPQANGPDPFDRLRYHPGNYFNY